MHHLGTIVVGLSTFFKACGAHGEENSKSHVFG